MDEIKYKEKSIIFDHLDYSIYQGIKDFSGIIIISYTALLVVLIILSQFLYWSILSDILSLLLGTNLLFLFYILTIMIALDKTAKFPKIEWHREEKAKAEQIYRKNRNKQFVILAIAVIIMFVGESYSDNYNFKCMDVYVEKGTNYYHVIDDCDDIQNKTYLKEIKGIDAINNNYELCPMCSDFISDADANSSVPSRYR